MIPLTGISEGSWITPGLCRGARSWMSARYGDLVLTNLFLWWRIAWSAENKSCSGFCITLPLMETRSHFYSTPIASAFGTWGWNSRKMRRWVPSLDVVSDGLHMGEVVWGLQSTWTGHWGISNMCQTLHRPFPKLHCSTEGSEQRKPGSTLLPSPALVWRQKSSWKRIAKADSSECDAHSVWLGEFGLWHT